MPPKVLKVNGKKFHSLPEAAAKAQVSPQTLRRWIVAKGCRPNGMKLEVVRDSVNKRLYVSADSLADLIPGSRLQPVSQ